MLLIGFFTGIALVIRKLAFAQVCLLVAASWKVDIGEVHGKCL
jgi:HAMP domain-containing protein